MDGDILTLNPDPDYGYNDQIAVVKLQNPDLKIGHVKKGIKEEFVTLHNY